MCGRQKSVAWDMLRVYNDFIDDQERRRYYDRTWEPVNGGRRSSRIKTWVWSKHKGKNISLGQRYGWCECPHKLLLVRLMWENNHNWSDHWLEKSPVHWIERLELFDEFEEWYMMQEHYCVAYAINDGMGLFGDFGFVNDSSELPS
ncbi:hypothetical protein V8G54_025192 [Vigna mungo]|uniref:Uncharacterized protein n=1 Tax=Vigna mungo TaxID=3915 RepID=A0AAQ3N8S8_VIGMU